MKTKLLIMASLFYPQKNGGGPPVSIMNIINSIKDKNKLEIYVISKNYEVNGKEPLEGIQKGWNDFSFGKVYYFDYGFHTITNVYSLIKEIKPDIIYQNSFFSFDDAIPSLLYKNKNTKLIIAPRGELCTNALKLKAQKKLIYIKLLKIFGMLNNVYFHTTGIDETNDIKNLFNLDSKFIYNIQNISILENNQAVEIKKEPNSLKMIFVARIQRKKNLHNAIKFLKNQTANIVYDIYGPMEEKEYWEICQKEISELPSNITVNYCGTLEQKQVPNKIKEYHLFFMPTLSENYGHSIVESLLSYRPIIISDQTPWNDVEKYNCGFAIPLEDEKKFEFAIAKFADMQNEEFQKACANANKYINEKLKISQIIDEYAKMFEIGEKN